MADFGFISDTDEESAVEAVISQAQDLCVLEQLSAINCSSFTKSDLPPDLDSRFRRLKSLPPPRTLTIPQNAQKPCMSDSNSTHSLFVSEHLSPPLSPSPSPTSVSDSFPQNSSPPSVPKSRSISKSRSLASPLPPDSSPPRKAGCFWCSPKKLSKKHNKQNRVLDTAFGSDEYLSDLGTFSLKEQQKILDKAVKEQDKINREAEKIINWAKQASARMTFHGIEDDKLSLSDDEPAK